MERIDFLILADRFANDISVLMIFGSTDDAKIRQN